MIESDKHDPSATIVRTLAQVLRVNANYLLGLSSDLRRNRRRTTSDWPPPWHRLATDHGGRCPQNILAHSYIRYNFVWKSYMSKTMIALYTQWPYTLNHGDCATGGAVYPIGSWRTR